MTARARIAVTGAGVVSPFGIGVEELRRGLAAGASASKPVPPSAREIPVPPEAGVLGEHARRLDDLVDRRRLRRASSLSRYAVAASRLAMMMARCGDPAPGGSPAFDRDAAAVLLGTAFGSSRYHFDYYEKLWQGGLRDASPLLFSESVMNSAPGHVSMAFGLRGPSLALVGGEEVGLTAISGALERLRLGEVTAALAGGAEEYCDFIHASLARGGLIAEQGGAAPFLSEGAAILLLEREDLALERGVSPLAVAAGSGAARGAGGGARAVERAVEEALGDAGREPGWVDRIIVSAAGGPRDPEEAEGLARVFGRKAGAAPAAPFPPAARTAPKELLGEGFAFTSAVQALIAVEALAQDGPAATPPARAALAVSLNRRGGAVAVLFERSSA
jgi:3-oxoacyl-(acyl-carrier-protein) synthase